MGNAVPVHKLDAFQGLTEKTDSFPYCLKMWRVILSQERHDQDNFIFFFGNL